MFTRRIIAIIITVVYGLLVIILGPVCLAGAFVTGLFGLSAYGDASSHFWVLVYTIAMFCFPFALGISVLLSWVFLSRHRNKDFSWSLFIPVPFMLLFAGLFAAMLFESRENVVRSLFPTSAADFVRLGHVHVCTNNDQATHDFAESIKRANYASKEQLIGYLGHAYCLAQAGDYDHSIQDYQSYIKIASSLDKSKRPISVNTVLRSIAYVYKRSKRYDEALQICDKVASTAETEFDVEEMLYLRNQLHTAMNDPQAAAYDLKLRVNRSLLVQLYPTIFFPINPRYRLHHQQQLPAPVVNECFDAIGYQLRS